MTVIFLVRLQEKFEIDHSWEWANVYKVSSGYRYPNSPPPPPYTHTPISHVSGKLNIFFQTNSLMSRTGAKEMGSGGVRKRENGAC